MVDLFKKTAIEIQRDKKIADLEEEKKNLIERVSGLYYAKAFWKAETRRWETFCFILLAVLFIALVGLITK